MEFKGTKGKWKVEQNKEYPTLHLIFSDNTDNIFESGTLVAKTCYAPQSEYNALLISKAPEMLEMLVQCKEWIENCNQYASIVKVIDRLIKEATEVNNEW